MQGLARAPVAQPLWSRIEAAAIGLAESAQRLLDAGADGLTPAQVHELRVVCKRLRALWRMLEPGFGSEVTRPPERSLREVARSLAGDREAAVRIKTLKRLARKADAPRLEALAGGYAAALAAALDATDALPVPDPCMQAVFREQVLMLRALPHPPLLETLAAGITASVRKARKSGRRAIASDEVECWHRTRRWAKYEHYQLELCLDLRGRWRHRHERLERFGVLLGRFNDLEDLAGHLQRLSVGGASPAEEKGANYAGLAHDGDLERLERLVNRVQRRLGKRIEKRFERLYRKSPSRYGRKLERRLLASVASH